MSKYRITIVEALSRRSFVCEIEAKTEKAARGKALIEFDRQYPMYTAHRWISMVSELLH